jgi:hypothetical protein
MSRADGSCVIFESDVDRQDFVKSLSETCDETGFQAYSFCQFSQGGKPIMENYFFHGKDVFDITLSSNRSPRYSVYFREPDKSVTWWLDRGGSGSFTERIFYDTNGDFSRHEVWYDQTWSPVDRRSEKNGIGINRQWHQLAFDTNGMWTIR